MTAVVCGRGKMLWKELALIAFRFVTVLALILQLRMITLSLEFNLICMMGGPFLNFFYRANIIL